MTSKGRLYRVLWEEKFGKLSPGMVLHHRCEQWWCINLGHLQAMTASAHNKLWHLSKQKKETCRNGHPYKGNLLRCSDGTERCHECRKAAYRKYDSKRRWPGSRARVA